MDIILRIVFFLYLFCASAFAQEAALPNDLPMPEQPATEAGENKPDYVVVLHGLGRTSYSMNAITNALDEAGYKTDNRNYHSTRDTLPSIIEDVYKDIHLHLEDPHVTVHFVCHSLGCLVTRGIITRHRPAKLGRVVMFGPPNQGSEYAEFLKENSLSNWIFGPNLPQLGTRNRRMLTKLIGTSADYDLGIIAGNHWIDPFGAAIIPGENDGKVSVERTMLEGMKDHIVLPENHTMLITDEDAIAQMLVFLKTGQFNHEPY